MQLSLAETEDAREGDQEPFWTCHVQLSVSVQVLPGNWGHIPQKIWEEVMEVPFTEENQHGGQRTHNQLMFPPLSKKTIPHAVSAILLGAVLGFLLSPFPLPLLISPSHGAEPKLHLYLLQKQNSFIFIHFTYFLIFYFLLDLSTSDRDFSVFALYLWYCHYHSIWIMCHFICFFFFSILESAF